MLLANVESQHRHAAQLNTHAHPFVEWLIGTVRREYLDHILFWTTADLENKLLDFSTYFNNHRTYDSLEGRTPDTSVTRPIVNIRSIRWQPHCRALYQTPSVALAIKGFLSTWRNLFGLEWQAGSSPGERCSQRMSTVPRQGFKKKSLVLRRIALESTPPPHNDGAARRVSERIESCFHV